jgi:hypothetical protein
MPKATYHEQADFTNPEHLKAHGLRLSGRDILVDDARGAKIGELTEAQYIKVKGLEDMKKRHKKL